MIRNYILTAIRSILRDKLTSFINIAGLALAMTSALMIYLFVSDEIRYDLYHTHADRTYRVTRNFLNTDGIPNLHLGAVAPPIGPLLKNDFGEIETMTQTLQNDMVMAIEEQGERKKMASEDNVFMAQPDLFRIFDIPVISGDPVRALERPLTVMLSEQTAMKYFESTDIIGKHLQAGGRLDLEITGILLVVHAHATPGKPFNGIPHNQTQATKPEDHQRQVRFKGLRSQLENPPRHIPESAYGSCPEEACHQTVPQELPWTDTTHPDEDRKDHPEPVKKPVAEKYLKAV